MKAEETKAEEMKEKEMKAEETKTEEAKAEEINQRAEISRGSMPGKSGKQLEQRLKKRQFMQMQSNCSLLEHLLEYSASDYYPFHMPGHKRQTKWNGMGIENPYAIDITEIYGFDNLHHAEGILKDSMEQTASCYGSDESWYLVNGSSGGILSAICGCTSRGGTILVSRNCHKSAYHGILVNELTAEYVYPQILAGLGIQGGIRPEDVEKKLEENPEIQAVMIVSPTYDGMVSDVKQIAEAAHRHGVPLLVDEAHGAHFPFGRDGEFPKSALELGADVVIQSLHKTLPSLTQTAILHMRKQFLGRERMERVRRYLSIYQSSSPSYVFMAAIENCIRYMDQEGREELSNLAGELKWFREQCRQLRHIVVLGREWIGQAGIYDMDCSKILMFTGNGGKSGLWLEKFLRERHHLELEMCAAQYGLALTSLWDKREGLMRLLEGLKDADRVIEGEKHPDTQTGTGLQAENREDERKKDKKDQNRENGRKGTIKLEKQLEKAKKEEAKEEKAKEEAKETEEAEKAKKAAKAKGTEKSKEIGICADERAGQEDWKILQCSIAPESVCTICTAIDRPYEERRLEECEGRISAEFVYLYPPGIPYLVPGEMISHEMILKLLQYREMGLEIQGMQDFKGNFLRVLREEQNQERK